MTGKSKKNKWMNRIVNRETVLYGIVGVGTSVLNVFLFQALSVSGMDYRYANFITLVIVKLAAYVCNKNLVFQSHTGNLRELFGEFGRFLVARGATMLIDYFGLIFMVEILGFRKFISKCTVTAAVIIINYFVGKKHVFKNRVRRDETV